MPGVEGDRRLEVDINFREAKRMTKIQIPATVSHGVSHTIPLAKFHALHGDDFDIEPKYKKSNPTHPRRRSRTENSSPRGRIG
jgi:hypothetical protein